MNEEEWNFHALAEDSKKRLGSPVTSVAEDSERRHVARMIFKRENQGEKNSE